MFDLEKLIEYLASPVNVVLSNPCIGSLSRIKIYLFLLSLCTDEFIWVPKIMTYLPTLSSVNENTERELNPIP